MPEIAVDSPEDFRQQLLRGMGVERGSISSHVEEALLVPGQVAAVWFSDNRLNDGRRVCVVLSGPSLRDIGYIHDVDPGAVERTNTGLIRPRPAPLSLAAVSRTVLFHLFGR